LSRVTGTLSPRDNNSLNVVHSILLDCGCTTNLLGLEAAEERGAKMDDASNIRLYNSSSENITVVDQSNILVDIPGLARREILTFLITPDLPREELALLGIRAFETLRLFCPIP
jgi:hypothetical protein